GWQVFRYLAANRSKFYGTSRANAWSAASRPAGFLLRDFRSSRHYSYVPLYRRRLPHIYEIGRPVFSTWRLYGSLPPNRFFSGGVLTSGRVFVAMDRLLDDARVGPV